MNVRPLAALGLLLACTAAWAQGTAPRAWKTPPKSSPAATTKAAPAPAPKKKILHYVDGVPDTGQFLPDTAFLGRIDDRVIRVRDFLDRWFASFMPDLPKSDSAGRFEFLNSMVNKEILADLAHRANRPLTFEDRQRIREARQRSLSNAVFARLVADSVYVSRADIEHMYEQVGFRLHLQQIVSDNAARVEAARTEVVSGRTTWAEAAKKYSNHQGDTGPDGDIGWLSRLDFGPAPALEIFDLPDAGISSLFHDDKGWRIVHVLGRRPEKRPALSVIAAPLRNEMMDVKLARRIEVVRSQIRQRIGMVYDTTNIAWASGLFRENEARNTDAQGRKIIDLGGSLPVFTPADTARVLARWNGGTFSLGAFLDNYNAIQPMQRDAVGSFGQFRSTVDRFVFEPFMAQLGDERGLEKDSMVVAQVARTEEQVRVEHLFSDSVESRVSLTPRDRRDYYEANKSRYVTWQNVHFAAITRPARAGADSVAARLKAGESAAAILAADSLAGHLTGSIRDLRQDERSPYNKILFEEMRPGGIEVVGPDKEGIFMVLQKLRHDGNRQLSYEEVQGLVDESLQNTRMDEALKALIARHRPEHVIELRPERMMLIMLVEPKPPTP